MPHESFQSKETPKSAFEELRGMFEKRENLQRRWSKLFEKIHDLDFKYPSQIQFDEEKRFRSDRGFYTPEDLAIYQPLSQEMKKVEAERDNLDQQILKRRFEIGIQHLKTNNQGNTVWKRIARHEPNPSNPMDIFHTEEWRCVTKEIDARIKMTGENIPYLEEGMRHMAEELGDTELLQRLNQWPEKRKLRFNNITLEFSSAPRSLFRTRPSEEALPGVMLRKSFDPYEPERDRTSAHLPISSGYSFPLIADSTEETAKNEMITLARRIGIESI